MSRIVYVNGEYLSDADAKISVFDRGFVFGDGVYEVVPVVQGKVVDRDYFLQRLDRSLSELELAWPCSKEEYLDVMQEMVMRNDFQEGIVYSQVTRGVANRDFAYPANTPTTFVAFTAEMPLLDHPFAEQGIAVATTVDLRWKRRDIKSINLLAQCMAKQDAVKQGAYEGWMTEDGFVTEGVSSSAYIVKGNTLITRPLSNSILPGIRRRTLLEMIETEAINVEQRLFTLEEALHADEAFISSATTLALGVRSIDGQTIGDGCPGPVTRRLRALYIARILAEAASQ